MNEGKRSAQQHDRTVQFNRFAQRGKYRIEIESPPACRVGAGTEEGFFGTKFGADRFEHVNQRRMRYCSRRRSQNNHEHLPGRSITAWGATDGRVWQKMLLKPG